MPKVLDYSNPGTARSSPPPRAYTALGIGMSAAILSVTATAMVSVADGAGQAFGLLCGLIHLLMMAVAAAGIVIAVRSIVEGPLRRIAGFSLCLSIVAFLLPHLVAALYP